MFIFKLIWFIQTIVIKYLLSKYNSQIVIGSFSIDLFYYYFSFI